MKRKSSVRQDTMTDDSIFYLCYYDTALAPGSVPQISATPNILEHSTCCTGDAPPLQNKNERKNKERV